MSAVATVLGVSGAGLLSFVARGESESGLSDFPKDRLGELAVSSLSFLAILTGVSGRGEPRLVEGD